MLLHAAASQHLSAYSPSREQHMIRIKNFLANLLLYFIITVGVNTSTMSFCFTSRQYYYSSPSLSSKLSSSSLSSITRSSFAKLRRQTVSTTSTTTTTTTTTFSNTQNQSTTSTSTTEKETCLTINLSTEVCRRGIQWDSIAIGDENRAFFATAVAFESEAEQKGVKPGMRLVAITDPIDKEKMWELPKNVTFVRAMDAIRSTRAYELTLTFEKEISVTREMVEYAKAIAADDEDSDEEEIERKIDEEEQNRVRQQQQQQQQQQRKRQIEKERPDLYSENWNGDEYVGTKKWNELTVGLAIAIAVPLIITIVATATNGVLWNVPDAYNRYR
jgi:hypothetical protein